MSSRKGAGTVVSAVVLAGVTLAGVGIVLNVAGPSIDSARDSAAIQRSVSFLNNVDNQIRQVASEGEGSTRTVSLDFSRGDFVLQPDEDNFFYQIRTSSDAISPQSSTTIGDVTLASNAKVETYETTINGTPCYMMENQRVKVCIKKVGSSTNKQSINTSKLLTYYKIKGGKELNMDFKVELNDQFTSSYGQGYTKIEELDDKLTKGEVTAQIDANNGFQYRVRFELYSGSDFVSIRVLPQV